MKATGFFFIEGGQQVIDQMDEPLIIPVSAMNRRDEIFKADNVITDVRDGHR